MSGWDIISHKVLKGRGNESCLFFASVEFWRNLKRKVNHKVNHKVLRAEKFLPTTSFILTSEAQGLM